MDVSDDYVQTLLGMGFPNEGEIRRALKMGKNDLNEALSILTSDQPSSSYDTLDELDVEMKDVGRSTHTSTSTNTPGPPPSYNDAMMCMPMQENTMGEEGEGQKPKEDEDNSLAFPVANLIELEGRVFTESWSIPYKKEESLGKCLIAATRLAEEGLTESDQDCKRFLHRCMPESFQKLLTSGAVHRWGPDIQEGIYDMLQLLIDLVAVGLKQDDIPVDMLDVLATTFNPTTEFHMKNRSKRPDKVAFEEVFGEGKLYATSPAPSTYKEPYGWLTNLINRFAEKGGVDLIKDKMVSQDLDAMSMSALLSVFGFCAEFLNNKVLQPVLTPGMEHAVKYVTNLTENDLKDKKVGCVCDMLASMKLICLYLWPNDVERIDKLRLDIVLRMLRSPHFNSRMNALKEITKWIEESSGTKPPKSSIKQDQVLDWLVENKVLSIALEGNIDQMQYCEKIKNIVDFLGHRLSVDELTKIWKMQNGETNVVIDNIHSIIAAAGVKFNSQQLEHLFILVQKSWEVENNKMREKLLSLIGKIGKDTRISKTTTRVLELLWDLAHLPALPTHLIERALEEHLVILSDSFIVKEQVKRIYVNKCVEDIKEGKWVLPALKQLLQIAKNIAKNSFHKAEKGILQELNKTYDIIKQVTNSLKKFHETAVTGGGGRLAPDSLVDGRYTHQDFVNVHLNFLQFILKEGALYLLWNRSRDIWDTLVANNDACEWDRETCFEWFKNGIADLEPDTQSQLFQKELLRLNPGKLSTKGFSCFKCFFENVNQYERKLKKSGSGFVVEKPDLIGLDFLWEVCLNTTDVVIAEMATSMMRNMSYSNLASALKKDPVVLHKRFIDECNKRLELCMIPLGGSAIAKVLSMATRVLTAVSVPEGATAASPSKAANMLSIERLLLIAERYVTSVEELHTVPRTILPHGASFQGHPIAPYCVCEAQKMEFSLKAHSNETVGSIRHKIAVKLKTAPDQVQIMAGDKMLMKDQNLLHQLNFDDNQVLSVRCYGTGGSSGSTLSFSNLSTQDTPGTPKKDSFDLEQEKMLPGVVMATGGQVFEMLYQLADLDEPRITNRARSLLKLIPTDPSVQDALDALESKHQLTSRHSSPAMALEETSGTSMMSPRSSPRRSLTGSFSSLTAVPPPSGNSNSSTKQTPKELLRWLFDVSGPGMSTFRLLYNLEVLSSRLMPTLRDAGTLLSAKTFCEEFLNSDGLSLVVHVLQKDAIPADVDYETRQGVYSVALQLLRFLLCGQDVTGAAHLLGPGRRGSLASLNLASAGITLGGADVAGSGSGSGPPSLEITPAAGSRAIQTMGVNDFTETVACFMRVAWAAAAGKLPLASSSQPIKDSSSMSGSVFSTGSSSRSSTGSSTSTGSDTESACLHPGVCVRQTQVSPKDTNIAKEALELLVTCLLLRSPLLATFYSLPCVSDFIVDVLVGSPQTEIRDVALDQFYLLSQTEVTPGECGGHQQMPHHFVLQTLLKARLPFWVSSSNTRGASYRLLKQCKHYFDLRCRLLGHLTVAEQQKLHIQVASMLEDELGWLSNFVPSENPEMKDTDSLLIAGHLRLIQTLLTCEAVDKRDVGKQVIQELLHDFLFPAANLIRGTCDRNSLDTTILNYMPKCLDTESRIAAYGLLVELADGCPDNLKEICQEMIAMHHQAHPETATQWEYMPPVDSRPSSGFVGLRNGGATCYMNSVLQQLFMSQGIPEALLGASEDSEVDEESVLYQVQQIFGHLLDSQLQYYVPEKFWKVFKLWGQPINVREQQDALDFYQAIIDQCDEHAKKMGKDSVFKKAFQGIYSDQKICQGCPHRYEREEVFFALNVTVKNATLQDSLDQFVKGELLEGDNAYFCEKCGEKRNTIKRMCIKTLPPVLCIQLKRFDYDWEANRALKFDDHFKFPWVLDMEPYTAEGMARKDDLLPVPPGTDSDTGSESPSHESGILFSCGSNSNINQINYELVGVVVHSGQANAGHYYSFIKDRRGNYMTNPSKGKWYKFNDTIVEEFDMSDATLEAECFGGKYKAKVFDQATSYPEERIRYWNGYLLFYEKTEEVRTPVSAKKSKVSLRIQQHDKITAKRNSDSLVMLTELVHKGEKKGIFNEKMPARIQQVVREENLHFMKNRDVYELEYFRFVRNLATRALASASDENFSEMCVDSLHLAVQFLFNTYFRTKRKLRVDMDDWVILVGNLLTKCKAACIWFVEFMASGGSGNLKSLIVECPSKEVRSAFGKMLEKTMSAFFQHGGVPTQKCFSEIVETLLSLLNKDVPDNCKHCVQYFEVLSAYCQMGTKSCSHMFGRQAFQRLMAFLLGPNSGSGEQESAQRRWSSMQARDFGPLHATLASLVLNCDVTHYRTVEPGKHAVQMPTTVSPQIYLKMAPDMHKFVFGADAFRYLREVVLSLREVAGDVNSLEDMLLYCSFCNEAFSVLVLKNIMMQYTNAPSNELKVLLAVLLQLLLLEDSLQLKRLQYVIDGLEEDKHDGMLAVIKSNHVHDSRRSYQCIKFLVSLANKCALAKDYLMQSSTRWQWAVNWLKNKMTEYYWSPSTASVTSNEDSSSKSFQRTISAQDTLAEATALLTELEAQEQSDMDILSNGDPDDSGEQSTPSGQQPQPESLDQVDDK